MLKICCKDCGEELGRIIVSPQLIRVAPCSNCMANEYKEGYEEGYDQGFDVGIPDE